MPNSFGRKWTKEALEQRKRTLEYCSQALNLGSISARYIAGDFDVAYIENENLDLLEMEAMFEVVSHGGKLK